MDALHISGKWYISSRRAAKEHGYHSDYIGQLIRSGKILGQKVGRSWYVETDSLANYLGSEAKRTITREESSQAPSEISEEFPKKPQDDDNATIQIKMHSQANSLTVKENLPEENIKDSLVPIFADYKQDQKLGHDLLHYLEDQDEIKHAISSDIIIPIRNSEPNLERISEYPAFSKDEKVGMFKKHEGIEASKVEKLGKISSRVFLPLMVLGLLAFALTVAISIFYSQQIIFVQ